MFGESQGFSRVEQQRHSEGHQQEADCALAWCFSREVMPDLAPSTSMGMKSSNDLASLLREACKLRVEAMPLLRPDTVLANLCSIS